MPSILITGGAGFIGSHLADFHIQQGDSVHIIDNLSTGNPNNLNHLKRHKRFQFTEDTVMNKPLLAQLVEEADRVYHLAAAVGVKLIVESPVRTIETNIGGTKVILEICQKKKKRLLIASTSEVYGKTPDIPFREEGNILLGPPSIGRWAYAASKALDEYLAIAYYKERKCPVVVARFFNTIGPRQTGQYGMVVPRFVAAALQNKDLEVYGTGKQSRSFTYVKDVVHIASKLIGTDACLGHVFNVGNGREIKILTLARIIIKLAGSKSKIRFVPYEKAYGKEFEDMERRLPSLKKLKKYIGMVPTTPLEVGLEEIIAHTRIMQTQT